MEQMDAAVARALLHQMIKCNQLKGFQAKVQKVGAMLILPLTLLSGLGKDFLFESRKIRVKDYRDLISNEIVLECLMQNIKAFFFFFLLTILILFLLCFFHISLTTVILLWDFNEVCGH